MKVLYVCNIFDNDNIDNKGITSDSPAAFVKVTSVCSALKGYVSDIEILSLGICNSKHKEIKLNDTFIKAIPLKYLNQHHNKFFRNLFVLISLYGFIKNRNPDIVIFYNYTIVYLLALLRLKFKKIKIIIDIEDGVNKELGAFRYFCRNLLLFFYIKCTNGSALTVSRILAKKYQLRKYFIVYGTGIVQEKIHREECLNVLFCGNLIQETGVDDLCSTISLISQDNMLCKKVRFHITGFGDKSNEIQLIANSNSDFVNFYGKVDFSSYRELLKKCHVGLVLKKANSSMGQTTFPSKFVEMSLSNLAIICSPVSDIPELFTKEEVDFVNNPQEIVNCLRFAIENPPEFEIKRNKLFEKSQNLFSSDSVGENLCKFLEEV